MLTLYNKRQNIKLLNVILELLITPLNANANSIDQILTNMSWGVWMPHRERHSSELTDGNRNSSLATCRGVTLSQWRCQTLSTLISVTDVTSDKLYKDHADPHDLISGSTEEIQYPTQFVELQSFPLILMSHRVFRKMHRMK